MAKFSEKYSTHREMVEDCIEEDGYEALVRNVQEKLNACFVENGFDELEAARVVHEFVEDEMFLPAKAAPHLSTIIAVWWMQEHHDDWE